MNNNQFPSKFYHMKELLSHDERKLFIKLYRIGGYGTMALMKKKSLGHSFDIKDG
jgi:hypothetical protein